MRFSLSKNRWQKKRPADKNGQSQLLQIFKKNWCQPNVFRYFSFFFWNWPVGISSQRQASFLPAFGAKRFAGRSVLWFAVWAGY
jgi:hypothetical protein